MLTNGLLANGIGGPVRFYLDCTAVSQEMEVVGCLFVAKTHTLIPTGIYARKMVFRVWRSLLAFLCTTHVGACPRVDANDFSLLNEQRDLDGLSGFEPSRFLNVICAIASDPFC